MGKPTTADDRPPETAPPDSPPPVDLSEAALTARQKRWLRPIGPLRRFARAIIIAANRLMMRLCFRVRAVGLESVPREGPFILAPTHASSLDPFALAAVLDGQLRAQTWWAGWQRRVLANPLRRFMSRITHTVPIEKDLSSLAIGAAVLRRRRILVWFPEGHRSRDGTLQPFKRGIGIFMREFDVPVIPVSIHGTHEAMPPRAPLPRRFPTVTVVFGRAVTRADLGDPENLDVLVERLRDRFVELRETFMHPSAPLGCSSPPTSAHPASEMDDAGGG